jgi:hypothetical protein
MNTLMKVLLVTLLVPSLAVAWSTPDGRHLAADRNDEAAMAKLSHVINEVGVTVLFDRHHETIEALCTGPLSDLDGAAIIVNDLPAIMICSKTSMMDADQVLVTLKHELFHVVQWCAAGKPDSFENVPAIGWDIGNFTREAFHFALNHYQSHEIMLEAEAQTFATTTSILGTAKTLQRYCVGE